jgi:hypothetical protein
MIVKTHEDVSNRPLRWDDVEVSVTLTNREWAAVRDALGKAEADHMKVARRKNVRGLTKHAHTVDAKRMAKAAARIAETRRADMAAWRKQTFGTTDSRAGRLTK